MHSGAKCPGAWPRQARRTPSKGGGSGEPGAMRPASAARQESRGAAGRLPTRRRPPAGRRRPGRGTMHGALPAPSPPHRTPATPTHIRGLLRVMRSALAGARRPQPLGTAFATRRPSPQPAPPPARGLCPTKRLTGRAQKRDGGDGQEGRQNETTFLLAPAPWPPLKSLFYQSRRTLPNQTQAPAEVFHVVAQRGDDAARSLDAAHVLPHLGLFVPRACRITNRRTRRKRRKQSLNATSGGGALLLQPLRGSAPETLCTRM